MRQTLFRIPLDGPWTFGPFELPGFGFGIVLGVWVLFAIFWLSRNRAKFAQWRALSWPAGIWLVIAAGIVMLPWIVETPARNAIAEADGMLESHPGSLEALIARSNAHYNKFDYGLAVDDLKTALRDHPQSPLALNRLAWIEATCPQASVRDAKEALANAKQACALTSSRNPEYLATLSAAQAEAGDFKEAVETQKQALRLATSPSRTEEAPPAVDVPRMRQQLQAAVENRPFRDYSAGNSFPQSLPVFGFGLTLFLGFTFAAWSAARRGAYLGYPPELMWDVAIWLFITGVIGCRIFFCVQYSQRVFGNAKDPLDLVKAAVNLPDGGLVWYGGLIAGAIVAGWICRRRNIPFLQMGDVLVPSLFVGLAFGRVGCFLNGCCYGDRCSLPWGVRFPMGSVPDMSLVGRGFLGADESFSMLLHPTQLYSSVTAAILFFLTNTYFYYRPRNGSVIALSAFCYAITRFTIEFLRDDEPLQFGTPFTISQLISIAMFVFAVGFSIWLSRRPTLQSAAPVPKSRRAVPV
jgi:phosphatidylglycerol:prolipoprotein diacylglycerol transferase